MPTATSVPEQELGRALDVDRPDADRGDVVLRRQPAAVLDEGVVELGRSSEWSIVLADWRS